MELIPNRARRSIVRSVLVVIWVTRYNGGIGDAGIGLKDTRHHIVAEQISGELVLHAGELAAVKYPAGNEPVPHVEIRCSVFTRKVELVLGDLGVVGSNDNGSLIGFVVFCFRKRVIDVKLPVF